MVRSWVSSDKTVLQWAVNSMSWPFSEPPVKFRVLNLWKQLGQNGDVLTLELPQVLRFAGDGVHGGWESMEPGAMVLGAMAEEDALALLSTLVVLALLRSINC